MYARLEDATEIAVRGAVRSGTLANLPPPEDHSNELLPAPESPEDTPALLEQLNEQLTDLPATVELIGRAIVDEPPLTIRDGGLIRDGQ